VGQRRATGEQRGAAAKRIQTPIKPCTPTQSPDVQITVARALGSPLADGQSAVSIAVGSPHQHKIRMQTAPSPVPSSVPTADAQRAVSGAVDSPHQHKIRTRRAPSPVPSSVPPADAQGAISGAVGSPHQHRDKTHGAPSSVTSALRDANRQAAFACAVSSPHGGRTGSGCRCGRMSVVRLCLVYAE